MLEPPVPADEPERIAALFRLHILDTLPEERFDRITATACQVFGVPIALITLVDRQRQWFKSNNGMPMAETPRRLSFCAHAIGHDAPLLVPDALQDARFADNPLVAGEPGLRFYAGIPLHAAGGERLGTLCILDHAPRTLTEAQLDTLGNMAMWAELELGRYSSAQARDMSLEKESRLQAIVDHAGEAIITIDNAGLIETFNPAAASMFGFRPEEVIGRPVPMLAAEHYQQEVVQFLEGLADVGIPSGGRVRRQVFARRKDGSRFPADLVVSQMRVNGWRAFTGIVRDISRRRRAADEVKKLNRQLAESLSLQQAILNSTNYAIIAISSLGEVTLFNDGAQRMLGYSEAEMKLPGALMGLHDRSEVALRAQHLSDELGQPIRADLEVWLAKARLGLTDEAEWTFIRKDGSALPVMLSITAVWDDQHELAGFVGIAHDLSARKKIEHMQNEFVSTVSHELRTPLTSIRGSLGLLAGGAAGEMPPTAKALLAVANRNCDRLVRLINDILDVEKIESGSMGFTLAVQSLLPMVEQAVAATQAFANQYQVTFSVEMKAAEMRVAVDADRLAQVLVNLLSNAAKFAPPGDTVVVRLARTGAFARVSVIDHGLGIPAAFRERIFQKFAQADASDTRRIGGTGLGLNISKAIIEKHHGRMDFTSEPGVRTEFFFELPLQSLPER